MRNELPDFVEAILDGDQGKSFEIVRRLRDKHSRLDIYHSLITPAMYEIGKLWQENRITVADEHLATGVCDFVLSQTEFDLLQKPLSSSKPKAMFFSIEDEWHQLGIKMVSILFKEHGWNVRYLNANLPLDHALNNAKVWKPEVIGMSISLAYRAPDLPEYIEAFNKLPSRPTILIGGRVMSSYDLSSIIPGNTMVMKDLPELNSWLKVKKQNRRDGINAQPNTSSLH
ncbi:cobalamin B12-binding domain-containing protein [Alteribacter natronophilus]|uniref:cobalamin B12-binding domain-containing protein n=1 Tax=Alteribacter natronophilus TaxID=2583810 RepID=UPI00110DFA3A|nr:cobalamin-dependent protein [Alteribacter natronophilus]TMW73357.1 cobalamin-binding protein [Alteribacter natronophilus]